MAAGRAAVVAEMADVGGCVVVGRPAPDAVLRVGRVLQRRAGVRGIVQSEGDAPGSFGGQIAELRIVRVHHERRVTRQTPDGLPPALGDALELAVPVELVAKEVAEADRVRPDAGCDVGERALVDLEQTELGVA